MSARTPSYRLHKSTNQAVVTLSGKDHYLGRYGTPESRAEFDRLIAEWLSNGRRLPTTDDMAVAELIVAYLRHADAYYVKNGRPTSEPGLLRLSFKVLRRLYGHSQAREFGPTALKAVRQAFIDQGMCRSEVNRRTGHVVRCFKWAVENELVPPSLHHALKAVSGLRNGRSAARESEPVKPVPDAFVDAVRPYVSRQIWAMIELQRLTGMRPGEVVLMRSCDLETGGKVWSYTPGEHKTEHHGKVRAIMIGPRGQAILRPWLKADLTAYLFSPREAEGERLAEARANRKTPVQPSQRDRSTPGKARKLGDHYTRVAYCSAIHRACNKAKVPTWGPNRLRHNAATAIRREFGLEVARAILGHSSHSVTLLYAEADAAKAAAAIERLG